MDHRNELNVPNLFLPSFLHQLDLWAAQRVPQPYIHWLHIFPPHPTSSARTLPYTDDYIVSRLNEIDHYGLHSCTPVPDMGMVSLFFV